MQYKSLLKIKNVEIHEPAICGSERINHRINIEPNVCKLIKKQIKSPINGATQFPVDRHQTTNDHDHAYI